MRKHKRIEERTSFQEAEPYQPQIDSCVDVAIVYGLNSTFESRLARWHEAGYHIHAMTGVAWGNYQGYVRGEWDGTPHYEDTQTAEGDFKLEHGVSQGHDVFYMMPSMTYARYLGEKLRRVVDAGAQAIYLEEPEFWVHGGYGEGFKREWQDFYGEPWQDPTSSPDARYRCAKLKQHLYTRALAYLFAELKAYAAEKGLPNFKCYVPTHSLINYAHWRIVSPESQLLTIPEFDGLIGQIWTGTSRTPTIYDGVRKQRTFETGYCEYAACAAIVRDTHKRLWQLADPIEDTPNYCWDDYRTNWKCTVAGSLLVPESERFEIMPWPHRIFTRSYPTINMLDQPLRPLLAAYIQRLENEGKLELAENTRKAMELFTDYYEDNGEDYETIGFAELANRTAHLCFGDVWRITNSFYKYLASWDDQEEAQTLRDAIAAFYHHPTDECDLIPEAYATELQIVFNMLADAHWPKDTEWLHGQTGVGLAISDSLMYQRGEPHPSNLELSSFYGLALPLVKHGTALTMVQLERVTEPGYLDKTRVLLLTYEGQKPLTAEVHATLSEWVHKATNYTRPHALILFGEGDVYNTVREWWNQDGMDYDKPQEHLTETLGLGRHPQPGTYPCGSGVVIIVPDSPAALAQTEAGSARVIALVKKARDFLKLPWYEGNVLALRRGTYVVAAGMDEVENDTPTPLPGTFVNLFDAQLTIHTDPLIKPDTRWLLYDLAHCPKHPWVIAAAGRVRAEAYNKCSLNFIVEGMADTMCTVRARLPSPPRSAGIDHGLVTYTWDAATHTVLLRFPNRPEGTIVQILF